MEVEERRGIEEGVDEALHPAQLAALRDVRHGEQHRRGPYRRYGQGVNRVRSTGGARARKRRGPPRAAIFDRDSVPFARVLAFTDGVFAIAATLLVVGIEVPELERPRECSRISANALGDLLPSIIGYVISFAVIGRYWYAHHGFFSDLRGIDRRLIGINLLYLGFIAFMPFPTGILGDYFENPLSIALYAIIVAIVSGLEVVMFAHAYRAKLLLSEISGRPVYRWKQMTSFLPVVFFLASVPRRLREHDRSPCCIWATLPVFGGVHRRWAPPGADEGVRRPRPPARRRSGPARRRPRPRRA